MVADKLRELAEAGVTRVRVHYTDLIGTTRAKVIPLDVLEEAATTASTSASRSSPSTTRA